MWGQDGWILAKLFFAFLWTETKSRSINSQKKNEASIQPSWLNKLGQVTNETKCEVKMAGYWPSSFFACLWTETKSRSINSQKKEWGQYPAILTEQTWSRGNFSFGIQRVSPKRARWLYLACSGSQSHGVIWFILPAHGSSHIIMHVSITQLVD